MEPSSVLWLAITKESPWHALGTRLQSHYERSGRESSPGRTVHSLSRHKVAAMAPKE